jgi:hypothetical protein
LCSALTAMTTTTWRVLWIPFPRCTSLLKSCTVVVVFQQFNFHLLSTVGQLVDPAIQYSGIIEFTCCVYWHHKRQAWRDLRTIGDALRKMCLYKGLPH